MTHFDEHDGHLHSSALHPRVTFLILGLGGLFVIGAWSFFTGSAYVGLVLGVVTLFTLIVLLIRFELGRIWRNHPEAVPRENREPAGPFRQWLAGDVEVWEDHMKGLDAAITALLPLAAVGVGAVLFAIAFRFVTDAPH